jgi:hypothetical protein
MDGKVGSQLFQPAFLAYQPDRLGQREGGGEQPVSDRLGHDVGDADAERVRARGESILQGFLEFGADVKNLVGVGQRGAAGIGEFEPPPAAAEQRDPEAVFQ